MSPRGSAQVPSQRFAWGFTGCRDTHPMAPLLGAPELGGPTRGSGACGAREGGGRSEHGPGSPHAHEPSSTTDSGSLLRSQGLCLHHGDKD